MDFSLTQRQESLRQKILDYGTGSREIRDDREVGAFSRAQWRELADLGIHGLPFSSEHGGGDGSATDVVVAFEALGRSLRDNGLLLAVHAHMWTCTYPISVFGREEQQERYLPGLNDGSLVGGNALTEPEAGSDAYSLRTRAEKRGDRYVLNGRKLMITNGPVADVLIVFANVDPDLDKSGVTAFIVDPGSPGFTVVRTIEKMGVHTAQMAEIELNDCEVPESSMLGPEGNGAAIFAHSMEWERGFILAGALGSMEWLIERCRDRARRRKQFGQAIGKFQLVFSRLVDMKLRHETSRLLQYRLAWKKDQGRSVIGDAARTKLYLSEAWIRTCEDAMSIYGGYGYLPENDLEGELRDALASRFYSGTPEIQRMVAARTMGL